MERENRNPENIQKNFCSHDNLSLCTDVCVTNLSTTTTNNILPTEVLSTDCSTSNVLSTNIATRIQPPRAVKSKFLLKMEENNRLAEEKKLLIKERKRLKEENKKTAINIINVDKRVDKRKSCTASNSQSFNTTTILEPLPVPSTSKTSTSNKILELKSKNNMTANTMLDTERVQYVPQHLDKEFLKELENDQDEEPNNLNVSLNSTIDRLNDSLKSTNNSILDHGDPDISTIDDISEISNIFDLDNTGNIENLIDLSNNDRICHTFKDESKDKEANTILKELISIATNTNPVIDNTTNTETKTFISNESNTDESKDKETNTILKELISIATNTNPVIDNTTNTETKTFISNDSNTDLITIDKTTNTEINELRSIDSNTDLITTDNSTNTEYKEFRSNESNESNTDYGPSYKPTVNQSKESILDSNEIRIHIPKELDSKYSININLTPRIPYHDGRSLDDTSIGIKSDAPIIEQNENKNFTIPRKQEIHIDKQISKVEPMEGTYDYDGAIKCISYHDKQNAKIAKNRTYLYSGRNIRSIKSHHNASKGVIDRARIRAPFRIKINSIFTTRHWINFIYRNPYINFLRKLLNPRYGTTTAKEKFFPFSSFWSASPNKAIINLFCGLQEAKRKKEIKDKKIDPNWRIKERKKEEEKDYIKEVIFIYLLYNMSERKRSPIRSRNVLDGKKLPKLVTKGRRKQSAKKTVSKIKLDLEKNLLDTVARGLTVDVDTITDTVPKSSATDNDSIDIDTVAKDANLCTDNMIDTVARGLPLEINKTDVDLSKSFQKLDISYQLDSTSTSCKVSYERDTVYDNHITLKHNISDMAEKLNDDIDIDNDDEKQKENTDIDNGELAKTQDIDDAIKTFDQGFMKSSDILNFSMEDQDNDIERSELLDDVEKKFPAERKACLKTSAVYLNQDLDNVNALRGYVTDMLDKYKTQITELSKTQEELDHGTEIFQSFNMIHDLFIEITNKLCGMCFSSMLNVVNLTRFATVNAAFISKNILDQKKNRNFTTNVETMMGNHISDYEFHIAQAQDHECGTETELTSQYGVALKHITDQLNDMNAALDNEIKRGQTQYASYITVQKQEEIISNMKARITENNHEILDLKRKLSDHIAKYTATPSESREEKMDEIDDDKDIILLENDRLSSELLVGSNRADPLAWHYPIDVYIDFLWKRPDQPEDFPFPYDEGILTRSFDHFLKIHMCGDCGDLELLSNLSMNMPYELYYAILDEVPIKNYSIHKHKFDGLYKAKLYDEWLELRAHGDENWKIFMGKIGTLDNVEVLFLSYDVDLGIGYTGYNPQIYTEKIEDEFANSIGLTIREKCTKYITAYTKASKAKQITIDDVFNKTICVWSVYHGKNNEIGYMNECAAKIAKYHVERKRVSFRDEDSREKRIKFFTARDSEGFDYRNTPWKYMDSRPTVDTRRVIETNSRRDIPKDYRSRDHDRPPGAQGLSYGIASGNQRSRSEYINRRPQTSDNQRQKPYDISVEEKAKRIRSLQLDPHPQTFDRSRGLTRDVRPHSGQTISRGSSVSSANRAWDMAQKDDTPSIGEDLKYFKNIDPEKLAKYQDVRDHMGTLYYNRVFKKFVQPKKNQLQEKADYDLDDRHGWLHPARKISGQEPDGSDRTKPKIQDIEKLYITEIRERNGYKLAGPQNVNSTTFPEFKIYMAGDSTSTGLEEPILETFDESIWSRNILYAGMKSLGKACVSQRWRHMRNCIPAMVMGDEDVVILKGVMDFTDIMADYYRTLNIDSAREQIYKVLDLLKKMIIDIHKLNPKCIILISTVQPVQGEDTYIRSFDDPGHFKIACELEKVATSEIKNFSVQNRIICRNIQLSYALDEAVTDYSRFRNVSISRALYQFVAGIHLTRNGKKILANEIWRETIYGWIEGLHYGILDAPPVPHRLRENY